MLKTLLLVNFRGAKRFLIFDFVIFQKPGEFTRFSPSFQISPSFHKKKLVNSPGFHQVFKFHQVFTKKKLVNSPGFHQVFKFHQVFTKKKMVNSPGFHPVFARFSPGFQISPSFQKKMVNPPGFFTRSFIRFWKFTRFSLSSHQVFRFFTKHGRSIRRCQNRIKFSLQ